MFLITGVFLFSKPVFSAETPPEKNTLCWLKKDCLAERGVPSAFVLDEKSCPGFAKDNENNDRYKWGKCLAEAGVTTQVSFGDNESFSNIADYIKIIYNYGLIVLGILAAVMIIVSGIQYISSAGNQEIIAGAKKRIVGAVIGLVLAYMSYTILGMVNPSTVNLRLPQVYLIREVPLNFETFLECDPKDSGSDAKCQEHYGNKMSYCQPLGPDGLEGPCTKVVRGSLQLAANVAILSTPIGGGAVAGSLLLGKGVITTIMKAGSYFYVQDKIFETRPIGICVLGNEKASAGSFCDPDGKKSKCADGLSCLVVPATQGLDCWTGSPLGICSSGKLNAVCINDNDCLKCKEGSPTCTCRPIRDNLSACVDGSFTSACRTNSECDSGQCGKYGYCVSAGGTNRKEGEICNLNDECDTGLSCFTSGLTGAVHDKETGQLDFSCDYKMINQDFLISKVPTQNSGVWTLTDSSYSIAGVCLKNNKENIDSYKNDFKTVWESNEVDFDGFFITCPK